MPDKTFGHALTRYRVEVAPLHRGAQCDLHTLPAMGRHVLVGNRLALVAAAEIASLGNERFRWVAPGSVLGGMGLMRSVFDSCRRDFGWLHENPMRDVTRPVPRSSRKRRISAHDVKRLRMAFGLGGPLVVDTSARRTGLAFCLRWKPPCGWPKRWACVVPGKRAATVH